MGKTFKMVILGDTAAFCQAISVCLKALNPDVTAIANPNHGRVTIAPHIPGRLRLDVRRGDTTGTQSQRGMQRHSTPLWIAARGGSDFFGWMVHLNRGAAAETRKSLPFREILARIRAALPRLASTLGEVSPALPPSLRQFPPPGGQWLQPDGSPGPRAAAEAESLQLAVEASIPFLWRPVLCERLLHQPCTHEDRAADAVINRPRARIVAPGWSPCIRSVPPTGYAFTNFPSDRQGAAAP